jgi:hypothetical protein
MNSVIRTSGAELIWVYYKIFSARLMHGSHSNIAKNTLNYIKKLI